MSNTITPPALPAYHKKNFRTLELAFDDERLCLMSAIRVADQQPVALVCAVNPVGGEYEFVPLAEMINGNPYELYLDPTEV